MPKLMKGETWQDACKLVRGQPRFQYPVMVEAKADEIRCQVVRWLGCSKMEYLSYAGRPLHNMTAFTERLREGLANMGLRELDIGILVNGNFNDSYRWVRSATGVPAEKYDKKTQRTAPALDASMVQIIVFDAPELTHPFGDRMLILDDVAAALRQLGLNATRPDRTLAHTEAEVLTCYEMYRQLGYEGAMAKTLDHVYARRRTFDWMKIKPKETFDGRITGFNEAVSEAGVPHGRVGSINVECADGSTASPAGIPHDLGRALWEDQARYVGQWIEFSCMEIDRKGGYRHPQYERFREDK